MCEALQAVGEAFAVMGVGTGLLELPGGVVIHIHTESSQPAYSWGGKAVMYCYGGACFVGARLQGHTPILLGLFEQ